MRQLDGPGQLRPGELPVAVVPGCSGRYHERLKLVGETPLGRLQELALASTASLTFPVPSRTAMSGQRQIQWRGCQPVVLAHRFSASSALSSTSAAWPSCQASQARQAVAMATYSGHWAGAVGSEPGSPGLPPPRRRRAEVQSGPGGSSIAYPEDFFVDSVGCGQRRVQGLFGFVQGTVQDQAAIRGCTASSRSRGTPR